MKSHRSPSLSLAVALFLATTSVTQAFVSPFSDLPQLTVNGMVLQQQNSPADILECAVVDEANCLKRELLQVAASYNRGYGSNRVVNENVKQIIQKLEGANQETNASRGISGNEPSPLKGTWRMIWTTAADVLLLEASPIFSTGAIYQVFHELPIVTNVIDFIPRAQSLFPNVLPASRIRAQVSTRATARSDNPNRVGLTFEKVQIAPTELFGQTLDVFPPLAIDLPKLPGTTNNDNGPGYFDVTYLDDEMLIIRQNAPGGLFVLVKVDSMDS